MPIEVELDDRRHQVDKCAGEADSLLEELGSGWFEEW